MQHIQSKATMALVSLLLTSQASAFTFTPNSQLRSPITLSTPPSLTTLSRRSMSSYDYDDDEDSEQHLADASADADLTTTTLAASPEDTDTTTTATSNNRFSALLESVGLTNQLSPQSIAALPTRRSVSCNDVFCNRELNLGNVRAIGFDMDYTIAQYKQPAFDRLAFDGAKEKLVNMGYPEKLLDVEYDHTFWVRGLIIDTVRGNFLKIDRHKYVRVAYHGFTAISSRTRKDLYSRFFNQVPSFGEKQFVNMDTLFQFVDASLFATLVEMKDEGSEEDSDDADDHENFLDFKTYEELYKDVRACVDLCHRDGVIKDEVARNPEKYIVLDENLVPMLQQFRENGVKVFLLTNSHWEYTSVAMNYLYHQADVSPQLKKKNEWVDLFDTVVVGSCKPAYLVDPYLNLFRVNPENGALMNTDGLFEIEALGENGAQMYLEEGKIFQGGNWKHLTAMLEIEAGEEILYVGDHLYSDVLRSKRTLGWRSAFIMPELPEEMETYHAQRPLQIKIQELRDLRDELIVLGDTLRAKASSDSVVASSGGADNMDADEEIEERLQQLEKDDQMIKGKLTALAQEYHKAFHPIWGMMFQAGYQDSRLAYFVTNYACLYTSKATNLGLTSTKRAFRTSGEMLPHDKKLADDLADFQQ